MSERERCQARHPRQLSWQCRFYAEHDGPHQFKSPDGVLGDTPLANLLRDVIAKQKKEPARK